MRVPAYDQTQDLPVTSIKAKSMFNVRDPSVDKVRFQGWRCHLVTSCSPHPHTHMYAQLPTSPIPQGPLAEEKANLCSLAGLFPLPCAQGALWWHSLAVPISSGLAHLFGHCLLWGAWSSGMSINAHLTCSTFLHPSLTSLQRSRKQELVKGTPTHIRSFSPCPELGILIIFYYVAPGVSAVR